MRTAKANYFFLIAMVILPVVARFIAVRSELFFSTLCVATIGCLAAVIRNVRTSSGNTNHLEAEKHLRRQMSIVMVFVIAGIASALHSLSRYRGGLGGLSAILQIASWLLYAYGLFSLAGGAVDLFRPARDGAQTNSQQPASDPAGPNPMADI